MTRLFLTPRESNYVFEYLASQPLRFSWQKIDKSYLGFCAFDDLANSFPVSEPPRDLSEMP